MKLAAPLCAALFLLPAAARAGSPVRYALVVGNDRADPKAVEIEPLRHAEREAREMAERLLQYADFDRARVETVVGGGRAEVLAAAARLAERHRKDRAELGDEPALFAFFFTGHGLSGKLVTASGSLSGEDLAAIVKQMDTKLTLGFFDACYAGALGFDALQAKGIAVTPGFNPVRELPREILDSEGAMWFVSSRENEVSYEDDRVGGLFMHFLGEAFTRADSDGVGISLERMWEYARRRTAEVASRSGRVQTPEKIVRSLKARGPLYFSFPTGRTATIRFEAPVEGTFLVQYVNAELTEKVEKPAGAPLDVPAFEGEVLLRRLVAGQAPESQRFIIPRGERVVVRAQDGALPTRAIGFSETHVRAKGELPGLVLVHDEAATRLALGAGVRQVFLSPGTLGAGQQLAVEGRLIRGPLSFGLELSAGPRARHYPSWSYSLWETGLQASVGYGLEYRRLRLEAEVTGGPSVATLRYGTGRGRTAWGGWLGGGVRVHVPFPSRNPRVLAWARASMGASFSQGIAAGDRAVRTSIAPQLGIGISMPFGGAGVGP